MRIAAALISLASIGAAPPSTDARLQEIIAPVSGAKMKQTVEKLVSFGTRHTLSSQTDKKRGIGAALNWTQKQFQSFKLPTERPCQMMTSKRVPTPTRVCDMIASLPAPLSAEYDEGFRPMLRFGLPAQTGGMQT